MSQSSRPDSDTVSVIIRFHDPSRLHYLDECLFSLACQSYRSIEAVVVTQDFSEEDFIKTKSLERPYGSQLKSLNFYNVATSKGVDARSLLINYGIKRSIGRYLAFLDFDDTVYSNCYDLLVGRIKETGAAICFGGTNRIDFFYAGGVRHKIRKSKLFGTAPKLAFFLENQYPIHSYIVDTWVVDEEFLRFDETLSRNEDYVFLMMMLAKYKFDEHLVSLGLCDYYINVDGGNTILAYGATPLDRAKWDLAEAHVEEVRRKLDIHTTPKDLKELVRWASGGDRTSALQERLHAAEARINSLVEGQVALAKKLEAIIHAEANPLPAPHCYLDVAEHVGGGRYRVAGWCAGEEGAAPVGVMIESAEDVSREINATQVRRSDVAQHLNVIDDLFGFEAELPEEGNYAVKFLAVDGKCYIGLLPVYRTRS